MGSNRLGSIRKLIETAVDTGFKSSGIDRAELDRIRNEQDFQKRRIEEKQVRALRHRYQAVASGEANTTSEGLSTKLGG